MLLDYSSRYVTFVNIMSCRQQYHYFVVVLLLSLLFTEAISVETKNRKSYDDY
jgi:hypothetical protein